MLLAQTRDVLWQEVSCTSLWLSRSLMNTEMLCFHAKVATSTWGWEQSKAVVEGFWRNCWSRKWWSTHQKFFLVLFVLLYIKDFKRLPSLGLNVLSCVIWPSSRVRINERTPASLVHCSCVYQRTVRSSCHGYMQSCIPYWFSFLCSFPS